RRCAWPARRGQPGVGSVGLLPQGAGCGPPAPQGRAGVCAGGRETGTAGTGDSGSPSPAAGRPRRGGAGRGSAMSENTGLALDYQPIGSNGKVRLTARLNGEAVLTDKLDLATEKERAAFVRKLCKAREGIDKRAVATELEKIAGDIVAKGGDEKD